MLFDMGMLRTTKTGVDGANEKARNWGPGLSSRLFALTIAFILIAEALILLPSIANFRDTWLNERVEMAQTAVLALEAAPERQVSDQLSRDLLERARIVAVAVIWAGRSSSRPLWKCMASLNWLTFAARAFSSAIPKP